MMSDQLVLPKNSHLYHRFVTMAKDKRMIFFAGLPGVGKSLLLQQMALLAHQQGRTVHLLQWDVARQPFESHDCVLTNYPEVDGVTHGVVRKAVGVWARQAVEGWHDTHPAAEHLLLGEVPLIGNRFIELAQPLDDPIEAVLGGPETMFVTPVPTREIRRLIEGRREESSANPQHEREQGDAIPAVMHGLWSEVYRVAHHFGLVDEIPSGSGIVYDPEIYGGIYKRVLPHRHSEILPINIQLQGATQSAYDLDIQQQELIPSPEDVQRCVHLVEQQYPDGQTLAQEIEGWFEF